MTQAEGGARPRCCRRPGISWDLPCTPAARLRVSPFPAGGGRPRTGTTWLARGPQPLGIETLIGRKTSLSLNNFTELPLTHQATHSFEVYRSRVVRLFTDVCNHHCHLGTFLLPLPTNTLQASPSPSPPRQQIRISFLPMKLPSLDMARTCNRTICSRSLPGFCQ